MPGWDPLTQLINLEINQLTDEGFAPEAVRQAAEKARALTEAAAPEQDVWAVFGNLSRRTDYAFDEPDDLESIRRLRPDGPHTLPPGHLDDAALLDKLHGAWLGRCAGCALGKPVDSFMGEYKGRLSWERQKHYLTAISPDEWPLKDYFPQHSPVEAETGQVRCPRSTREEIAFMESDDDINYTVLGQVILQQDGASFNSGHVAAAWLRYLPYSVVCTAETQAYRNIVQRYDHFRYHQFREAGRERFDGLTDWHWVTHHLNPYRELIGAQIRVDSYGYAAPGQPELAAEFAWRDARISHTRNGIYGAMFCAAMIAAAFAQDDPSAIVETALAEIPRTSRLHADLRAAIAICERHGCEFARFEAVLTELNQHFAGMHCVHTNNNAALCVVAVLLSGGDFHRGITLAVMGGWDSDCNGATVGSVVGAITGGIRAPAHWTGRLNDTLHCSIAGRSPASIRECAERSLAIVQTLRVDTSGGTAKAENGESPANP